MLGRLSPDWLWRGGMTERTQGYQIIATGDRKYLFIAVNCAASLRHWDPGRPIQLVTDAAPDALAPFRYLFDVVTPYRDHPVFTGPLVKLRMFEFAVFDETMFVDADCLLLKPDIDAYWRRLSEGYDVAIPGTWESEGPWYNMDIAEICRIAGIERLLKINSGVCFFKRNAAAAAFFDACAGLYDRLGNFTKHIHRDAGPPDEPYFAIAFGALGRKGFPYHEEGGDGWMITTIQSRAFDLDAFSGRVRYTKADGRVVSPSLVHFVGLQPNRVYRALSRQFLRGHSFSLREGAAFHFAIRRDRRAKYLRRLGRRLGLAGA